MHILPVIFTGIAPTKSEIDKQCKVIIDAINESGEINPLRVATTMKALEFAMKAIKDGITEQVLDEAQKYESKSFEFDGHQMMVQETGTKYDFSLCCDPVLAKLERDAEAIKVKLTNRQKFLKSIDDQMTVVDEDSGEVFTVLPPSKSSTTGVVITLAK